MQKVAYLSLGSNLGDRAENLRTAVDKLQTSGEIFRVSSLYETEPVEFTEQPWFLNCAVGLATKIRPRELLSLILTVEREMGRERIMDKGPRNIDLDILLFGSEVIETPKLTIPHPAMHQRRFVLEPLAEIAPDVEHPLMKKSIRELCIAARDAGPVVTRIEAPDWVQKSRA